MDVGPGRRRYTAYPGHVRRVEPGTVESLCQPVRVSAETAVSDQPVPIDGVPVDLVCPPHTLPEPLAPMRSTDQIQTADIVGTTCRLALTLQSRARQVWVHPLIEYSRSVDPWLHRSTRRRATFPAGPASTAGPRRRTTVRKNARSVGSAKLAR